MFGNGIVVERSRISSAGSMNSLAPASGQRPAARRDEPPGAAVLIRCQSTL